MFPHEEKHHTGIFILPLSSSTLHCKTSVISCRTQIAPCLQLDKRQSLQSSSLHCQDKSSVTQPRPNCRAALLTATGPGPRPNTSAVLLTAMDPVQAQGRGLSPVQCCWQQWLVTGPGQAAGRLSRRSVCYRTRLSTAHFSWIHEPNPQTFNWKTYVNDLWFVRPCPNWKFHPHTTFHLLLQQDIYHSPVSKEKCFRQLITLENKPVSGSWSP